MKGRNIGSHESKEVLRWLTDRGWVVVRNTRTGILLRHPNGAITTLRSFGLNDGRRRIQLMTDVRRAERDEEE